MTKTPIVPQTVLDAYLRFYTNQNQIAEINETFVEMREQLLGNQETPVRGARELLVTAGAPGTGRTNHLRNEVAIADRTNGPSYVMIDIDNIVAIKESSEDPRRITHIRNHVGDRFTLFCGVDDLVMESFILGAEGWISGLVNAFPAENRLLWDLLTAGKFDEARRVYQWYTPLLQLDTLPKLVQYIKLASQECGFGTELTRAPRLPLVGEERERILKLIRDGIKTRPATKR